MQQRFAAVSGMGHTREATEGERKCFVGNAPMGTQPAPQERPNPFHGMDMDFTKAVAIFIAGVLSSSMIHMRMVVSPRTQASINAVFIRVYKGTWGNGKASKSGL